MLGKLSVRQEENTAFHAFHWKISLFQLVVETETDWNSSG